MENRQEDYNKSKVPNQGKQVQFFNPRKLFYGAFIPNAILKYPKLTPSAKLLYARLIQFAGTNNYCFPSYSTLSQELSLSKRQIIRLIKELEREGFIYIERVTNEKENTSNRFWFIWHKCFEESIFNERRLSPGDKMSLPSDIDVTTPSDIDVTLINSNINKFNEDNIYMSPPYSTVTDVTNIYSKAFRCKKCKNLVLKERESKKFSGVCLDCEKEYEKLLENKEIFRCLECKKLFKKEEILLADKNQGICFKCYFGEKNSSLRRLKAIKANIVKPIISDEERTKLDEKIAKEERRLKRKNK